MNPGQLRPKSKLFPHTLLFVSMCQAIGYSSLGFADDTTTKASDNPLDAVVVVGNRGQARTLAESTSPAECCRR
jgi:iron complex outermembrane receptor protein